ncbi:MAG: PAS domain-containing protein [Sporocytophaga sp.]|uniref:PAS domain-containing protein n=1 Tax=Sporocytophaga sp. TaxID=2231183 RepID=UPI001B19D2F3|nr:PAS domain-containing protein [Sporocytophaga sp.]MBO9700615.1 PAS domain-containing protein [Sporocytophaga sp.]
MKPKSDTSSIRNSTPDILIRLGKVLIVIASVIPALNIIGRSISFQLLTKVTPGHIITMNPLSSVCFVVLGVALWMLRKEDGNQFKYHRLIARCLALAVAIVTFAKVLSLVLSIEFKLDIILFREQLYLKETQSWNGMAPNTAFSLFLLSTTIIFIDKKFKDGKNPFQYLNFIVILIALLSMYGYIYGVRYLYGILSMIPMSFYSALCLYLFSTSVLFLRPYKGQMRKLIGENPIEVVWMRLAALILPLIIGYLKMQGENMDLYDKEFGTAIFTLVTYTISMILLGRKSSIQFKLRSTRKEIEDLRKAENERLNYLFDHSSTAIYIRDIKGRFIFINKRFEEIFGKRKDEIVGKTPEDVWSDGLMHWFKYDEESLNAGIVKENIESITTEIGKFDLDTKKFPIKHLDEEIYAICGMSTDLTALKNSERKIVENNKLIHSIIELIGEMVFVVDKNGNFILYNEKAKRITEQVLFKYEQVYESKFFYPDRKTSFPTGELPGARALRGLATRDRELFVINDAFPEGKIFRAIGEPLLLSEDKLVAIAIYRDITKRRMFQQRMKESESRIKDILSTIGEGIIISDKNGKFLQFNSVAINILGKGPVEIDPSEWPAFYGLYQPDGKTLYSADHLPLQRALRGETVSDEELVIITESKEVKRVLISAKPIRDDDGIVIAGLINFRNITEFRHVEQAMKEVEEKYQELHDFLDKLRD